MTETCKDCEFLTTKYMKGVYKYPRNHPWCKKHKTVRFDFQEICNEEELRRKEKEG